MLDARSGWNAKVQRQTSLVTGPSKPHPATCEMACPHLRFSPARDRAPARELIAWFSVPYSSFGVFSASAPPSTINRDLFEESLRNHKLRRFREEQLEEEKTVPEGTVEMCPRHSFTPGISGGI